jgi:hypothetical protein
MSHVSPSIGSLPEAEMETKPCHRLTIGRARAFEIRSTVTIDGEPIDMLMEASETEIHQHSSCELSNTSAAVNPLQRSTTAILSQSQNEHATESTAS